MHTSANTGHAERQHDHDHDHHHHWQQHYHLIMTARDSGQQVIHTVPNEGMCRTCGSKKKHRPSPSLQQPLVQKMNIAYVHTSRTKSLQIPPPRTARREGAALHRGAGPRGRLRADATSARAQRSLMMMRRSGHRKPSGTMHREGQQRPRGQAFELIRAYIGAMLPTTPAKARDSVQNASGAHFRVDSIAVELQDCSSTSTQFVT